MSLLRVKVQHIFDCFCEVSTSHDGDQRTQIIQKFPDSFQEDSILDMVPNFTYPCTIESRAVEHFSFVLLKDLEWLYGFCRHSPDDNTAVVLLSALPWHDLLYKLLDRLRQVMVTGGQALLQATLTTLYHTPVPADGARLHVQLPDGLAFSGVCPDRHSLPALLEDRNLTEYWSVVDDSAMVEVFTALLNERHVLVTSSRVSRLSACVQAAQALLYPLWWQRIFLPVVPAALSDCLASPVPFLVGAPAAVAARLEPAELPDGCVRLDADTSCLSSPLGDMQALPADVAATLKRQLRHSGSGDGVSRAFQTAVVQLVGGYRHGIRVPEGGGRATFDEDAFVQSQPSGRRPFLRSLIRTQMFERLWLGIPARASLAKVRQCVLVRLQFASTYGFVLT
ncbi:DENN domain-containing protein 1B-like [Pollicipes pollicipes]|uniref:DENN domain-containing protein 1B-like n=1 Tax=Pollicipes pollicipes TaxID=41117 RepID=UPI0018852225|nr:DENN domain-containing protein 1B-like [Pollicipes pollicipes]